MDSVNMSADEFAGLPVAQRTFYLRNGKGERVVCIFAEQDHRLAPRFRDAHGIYRVGVSVWNGKQRYDRHFARDVAIERSVGASYDDVKRPGERSNSWRRFTVAWTSESDLLDVILASLVGEMRRQIARPVLDADGFPEIVPGKLVRALHRTIRERLEAEEEAAKAKAEAEKAE